MNTNTIQLENTEYKWDLVKLKRLAQKVQEYEEQHQDSQKEETCQTLKNRN